MRYIKKNQRRSPQNEHRNHEGYSDPTACIAIERAMEADQIERLKQLTRSIELLAAAAGFHLEYANLFIMDAFDGTKWEIR